MKNILILLTIISFYSCAKPPCWNCTEVLITKTFYKYDLLPEKVIGDTSDFGGSHRYCALETSSWNYDQIDSGKWEYSGNIQHPDEQVRYYSRHYFSCQEDK